MLLSGVTGIVESLVDSGDPPDQSARFTNLSATDRAVAFLGEGPLDQTQPVPSVRIALANAWAPDKLLYLADFASRTQTVRGGRVQVVDP